MNLISENHCGCQDNESLLNSSHDYASLDVSRGKQRTLNVSFLPKDIFRCFPSLFMSLLFIVFFLSSSPTFANCHYIVAVDLSYPDHVKQNIVTGSNTRETIFSLLDRNGFNSSDYLSVVSYSVCITNPDFDNYVTAAVDISGRKMTWMQFEDAKSANSSLCAIWQFITQDYHLSQLSEGPTASIQSLSKQYIIRAAKSDSIHTCNSVILLLITDDEVNGTDDDYRREYDHVMSLNRDPIMQKQIRRKSVFTFIEDCNKKFRFDRTRIRDVEGKIVEDVSLNYKNLKIVPYVVRPSALPSVHSISDIPTVLPFINVKGGYKMEIDVNTYDDIYAINSMSLSIKDTLLRVSSGKWTLHVDRGLLRDGDSLTFAMSVKYCDGIYDGLVMSHEDPYYCQGLSLRQEFRLQQDNKLFGHIVLPDFLWLFWKDNFSNIKTLWEAVIILVAIVLICIIFFKVYRRVTLYIPDNELIHIEREL